jgi:2-phospho-L-lactate guanylyltransferase
MVALIPVKQLDQAKSRLQRELSLEARAQLMHDTLRRTVHALQSSNLCERISIVTLDERVKSWAREWGVSVISEHRNGLNEALSEARGECDRAKSVLVVHGDVAWLEAEDVRAMAALAEVGEHAVVIAPDRHDKGTNAMLLKPPCLIDFAYGEGSAHRHAQLAREAGVEPIWYRSTSVSLDIDVAADLKLYESAPYLLDE